MRSAHRTGPLHTARCTVASRKVAPQVSLGVSVTSDGCAHCAAAPRHGNAVMRTARPASRAPFNNSAPLGVGGPHTTHPPPTPRLKKSPACKSIAPLIPFQGVQALLPLVISSTESCCTCLGRVQLAKPGHCLRRMENTSPRRGRGGAADAQAAHHATSSTAPAHQPLGSANTETTPARAPAAAADRKQPPDATCEGKNG